MVRGNTLKVASFARLFLCVVMCPVKKSRAHLEPVHLSEQGFHLFILLVNL